ncbi:hypothetical protein B0A75_19480 [Flavobacterium oncorhynchi]|uniref:Uncharacterized protein n=1 Tax=Flavobacterium oncorhynchi TaxID=728056 RepID=A0A226HL67_9FLAO|nr:hypothetical protein [Flavobacterium oncorhynchi]OXA95027.1 hypothetical protein B0A75_19480 [Flavobacterium oncorhynchi]
MEKRTEGAWIINHTKKIQDVTSANDFGDLEIAGKCGLFLSNLAASDSNSTLTKAKVEAIARSANIKKVEIETIKSTLKDFHLIDVSSSGDISVIGVTTAGVLGHTANIFDNSSPDNFQRASLELANYSSDKPVNEKLLKEFISDSFLLDTTANQDLFNQSEEIGLIDYEIVDSQKTYFNGNLFKRNDIEKTTKILSSLTPDESRKVNELDAILTKEGCVTQDLAISILGNVLMSKLQAIAMYDFNEVSNDRHSKVFLTKPSSFSKFGNPFEDDALDMAKSFIASLIYGMKISTSGRGRIEGHDMLKHTLRKLLRGEKVGPCTAIGQDYKILELSRVIELQHSRGNLYYMKLLKFDIGQLALNVLVNGDLAEESTLDMIPLSSASASIYTGPEKNRMKIRTKKDTSKNINVGDLLRTMRTS